MTQYLDKNMAIDKGFLLPDLDDTLEAGWIKVEKGDAKMPVSNVNKKYVMVNRAEVANCTKTKKEDVKMTGSKDADVAPGEFYPRGL